MPLGTQPTPLGHLDPPKTHSSRIFFSNFATSKKSNFDHHQKSRSRPRGVENRPRACNRGFPDPKHTPTGAPDRFPIELHRYTAPYEKLKIRVLRSWARAVIWVQKIIFEISTLGAGIRSGMMKNRLADTSPCRWDHFGPISDRFSPIFEFFFRKPLPPTTAVGKKNCGCWRDCGCRGGPLTYYNNIKKKKKKKKKKLKKIFEKKKKSWLKNDKKLPPL